MSGPQQTLRSQLENLNYYDTLQQKNNYQNTTVEFLINICLQYNDHTNKILRYHLFKKLKFVFIPSRVPKWKVEEENICQSYFYF